MRVDTHRAPTMSVHQPIAINHSHTSENRIHSDDVARAYGFTGALVPGVAVFGHMTYPLTRDLGLDWLEGTAASNCGC